MELVRSLIVVRLCGVESLVRNNHKILRVLRKMLGKRMFDAVLKATFFGHFVAGETKEEVKLTADRLAQSGIGASIGYSTEAESMTQEILKAGEAASTEQRFPVQKGKPQFTLPLPDIQAKNDKL
ncbi:hypothetical protein AAVH_20997 [Aphelenchoides avenae]|nr:hypothetical protein AAVH_20997 [Aphelenchus avenae]